MITTTATKNRSSTLLIYPPEPLEIDFGNLLIPMDDDDFFIFVNGTGIYGLKWTSLKKSPLCHLQEAKPGELILP